MADVCPWLNFNKDSCSTHDELCIWLCIDCPRSPLCCESCRLMHTNGHTFLKVYQYSQQPAVRVAGIPKQFGTTDIQQYFRQNEFLVLIHTKTVKDRFGRNAVPCKSCQILVKSSAKFCSIECKMNNLRDTQVNAGGSASTIVGNEVASASTLVPSSEENGDASISISEENRAASTSAPMSPLSEASPIRRRRKARPRRSPLI